jgi:hypothetical protein
VFKQRGAKFPDATSPWRLNYIRWSFIIVGPQYEACYVSSFWRFEFGSGNKIFGKSVHHSSHIFLFVITVNLVNLFSSLARLIIILVFHLYTTHISRLYQYYIRISCFAMHDNLTTSLNVWRYMYTSRSQTEGNAFTYLGCSLI